MSNKDYYAPVLEDEELFVESKEKFDTATTSQSPQELEKPAESSEAEKEESSDSPAEPEPAGDFLQYIVYHQLKFIYGNCENFFIYLHSCVPFSVHT